MDDRTSNAKHIIVGTISVLLFIVLLFGFFAIDEQKSIQTINKFYDLIALPSESSSSNGLIVFGNRSRDSSEDESSDSGDSSSVRSAEESSKQSVKSSSASKLSSSAKSSSSSSSVPKPESSSSELSITPIESDWVSAPPLSSSSASSQSSSEDDGTVPIIGTAVLTKQQLMSYSSQHESNMRLTCSLSELIDLYLSVGARYGIRGDIAYLQAVNETGWFKFNRPSSYLAYVEGAWVRIYEPRPEGLYVVPTDNNFCGLGVTGKLGDEGSLCRFATAALGVEAHIQHLYAYATANPLPGGTSTVDPRFRLVSRGCAPNWNDLGNGNWASSTTYGRSIINSYLNVLRNY